MDFAKSLGDLRTGNPLLTQCNEQVDTFRKTFHSIMKSKGYERKAALQSALYHWDYTQGSWAPGKRRIAITGWHGTGRRGTNRWWGDAKTFFNMYDTAVPGFKAVVDVPSSVMMTGDHVYRELLDLQQLGMDAALAYVRNKA